LVPGPADVKYQPTNPLDKPVLDPEMFQQLLAAAFTLQEQDHHPPVEEAKADSPVQPLASSKVSLPEPKPENTIKVAAFAQERPPAASFKLPQSKPARLKMRPRMMRKRNSPNHELFWKAATLAAVAAVSALLLAAWIDHPSPLPAGLALPSELLQQQVPFRKGASVVTAPPPSSGISPRRFVTDSPAATKAEPNDATLVDDLPRATATPASARKTIANRNRYSTYASEAGIVAPDTVVRYGPRPAVPRVQLQSKP
jgi:hypothetical protein